MRGPAAALGAVWLVIDARTALFPLLETWPDHSRTTESVLVQRASELDWSKFEGIKSLGITAE